ncbi:radc protein [Lucifera butyrica]|uniref:Radc protein n=1 Tax=Lucifera butyrica TaxID=1351585 RepID=A0A498R904_9FIRM|nr:DNA repair protein RadC [Lucifera butyrica]VBB07861.1 radc protein [Lucifera butyrica]
MITKNPVRSLMIKELPESERPREKMMQKGSQALSEADLLAILLRTGTKKVSVKMLAEELLAQYGINGLGGLTTQELSKVPGIGVAKAVTVLAGIELGKRLSSLGPGEKVVVRSPQDAAHFMMGRLRYEAKEHFIVLLLSTKNHIIAAPTISIGSLNASVVHPRELFREAVNYAAASVILIHNHPSGDPTPSQEDIALTHKLADAGELLGISVLDHVIIGDGKYVSFKEKGIL